MNACVHNLNWTHFRSLLRVDDENARMWYLNEASSEGWNTQTLDRNIATQYYNRLLTAPDKEAITIKNNGIIKDIYHPAVAVASIQHCIPILKKYIV